MALSRKKRVVLNPRTVCEIESLAPTFADCMRRGVKTQISMALSERFGVDPKTIRDIWNKKSWKGRAFNNDDAPQQSKKLEAAQKAIADSFLRDTPENGEDWGWITHDDSAEINPC
jgi:hypothetical protein